MYLYTDHLSLLSSLELVMGFSSMIRLAERLTRILLQCSQQVIYEDMSPLRYCSLRVEALWLLLDFTLGMCPHMSLIKSYQEGNPTTLLRRCMGYVLISLPKVDSRNAEASRVMIGSEA